MPRPMKDSGVEWLGEIPAYWEIIKLKYISRFMQTKYIKEDGKLNYIGLENIVSWNGKFIETDSVYDIEQSLICEVGDILFGKLRPYLAKVYLNTNKQCCSGEFAVIKIDDSMCRPFFFYQLISHGFIFMVDRSTYGTKMPRANADFIKNISVLVPPLDEQQRIATFLDGECARIDSVIEKTRASIVEYKKLKQAIITRAVTKGIRPARTMKDSGVEWLGEIPTDWEVMRIKNIIQQTKNGIKIGPFGSALTNKTIGEGEFNVYSQANLIASDFSSTKNTIRSDTFEELKSYEVFPDDICLSMMGTIGKCKKVPNGIKRGIMDSHLIKIRLADFVDSRFFEYVYDKDLGGVCFAQMQYDKKGFIMDGLNTHIIKNLYFPVPPLDEQKEIAQYLDEKTAAIDLLVEKKNQLVTELERLKKSLIFEYVTGKKAVPQ